MLKNSYTVTSNRKNVAEKVSKIALHLQLSMYNTKYLQLPIKTQELAKSLGIFSPDFRCPKAYSYTCSALLSQPTLKILFKGK